MIFKAPLAVVLVAAFFLGAAHAPAMDILFFARMNVDDQATYVSEQVESSAKMLRQTGHPDQAAKAIALFKDSTSHGGVSQLAANLKALQAKNTITQNMSNTHNIPIYNVEAALQITLRDNGVQVPLKFLETSNRNFAPQLPLKPHL